MSTTIHDDDFPMSFWDDPLKQEQFVRALPKMELHVHLDGSLDPTLLWRQFQKHPELLQCFPVETQFYGNHRLRDCVANCQSVSDYRRLTSTTTRRRRRRQKKEEKSNEKAARDDSHQHSNTIPTLQDMLLCFEFFLPLVYHSSVDFLEELAYDFVQRQAEQNIIYTEVRYAPHLLHENPRQAVEAVTKGLRRGCRDFPHTIVNQILCAISFQPENTPQVLLLAQEYFHQFPCAVVGLDVAAGEDHFDTDSHYATLSQRGKIPLTLHAGEVPGRGATNIIKAMDQYSACRIGHGYQILEDPKIFEELIQKHPQIHFETCLDSSVQTGGWIKETKSTTAANAAAAAPSPWMNHPANTFLRKGISMSISSDDPSVFNTSLTWQWRIAIQKMKWNRDDCQRVLSDTVQASFASIEQKAELQRRLVKFFDGSSSSDVSLTTTFTDRVHYDEDE